MPNEESFGTRKRFSPRGRREADSRVTRTMDTGRAKRILRRGLKLRCPDCGLDPLYRSLFRMNTHCDYCGLIYEREQGYFVGAIYFNIIATESLLLATLIVYGLMTGEISESILAVLIALAFTLPLVFFHHSRSLWLCVDHILNPREKPIRHVDFDSE